jgi:uncharacterized protein
MSPIQESQSPRKLTLTPTGDYEPSLPTPLERALQALEELHTCPTLEFIGEADGYLDSLAEIALAARLQGGAIHDARIAAICRFHGVRELWSADRDLSRFAADGQNPLISLWYRRITT